MIAGAEDGAVVNLHPQPPTRGIGAASRPHEPQTKAITKTEFLADRVCVHFFCHRPWGVADERTVVELSYPDIGALPALPTDHGHGEFRETWEESIYIPTPDVTVIFRFAAWQESDDCRMEGLVGGPYLVRAQETGALIESMETVAL